ncbi:unnamed protein product [Rhizophagus irregularis]|uniref:ADP/ATP translocase n=1 Tax=Rhizophagus irregularis TaxID=588596 RepID=A0A915ZI05_9GLOM|nr:unnamed protein product [Rhizophagus irregularis]
MVMPKPFLNAKKGGKRQFHGLIDVYHKTLKSDGIIGLYRGTIKSKLTPFHKQSGYDRISDKLQSLHLNLKSIQSIYFNNNDFRNQIIDKKKFTQHLLSGWKLYPGYYSIFKLSKL